MYNFQKMKRKKQINLQEIFHILKKKIQKIWFGSNFRKRIRWN